MDEPNLISRLADEVLPALARDNPEDYPVRFDHCFRRIAYDYAAGQKWDEVIEPPFYKNASGAQLSRAIQALETMIRQPEKAKELNEQSLSYRT
jgi:hypothetical protein